MSKPMKVKKVPVTVEAMLHGHTPAEGMEVYRWIENNTLGSYDTNLPPDEKVVPESGVSIDAETGCMVIATLEGEMHVSPGDYVIRGVKGEFYPCKPDIFEATYQVV